MMLAIGVAVLLLGLLALLESEMPSDVVPEGLGVNIHFSGERDRDLDLVRDAGFRFIRDDLFWQTIEKEKGVYDFTPYDQLTDGLLKRGIRPLYILCYSNPLYETALSVRTEAGRQAFAKWAATAAERYRGKGVIWELWNEPDGDGFWNPQPSINDYMALAKVALPAIREADPDALRVAPAATHVPLDFLDECFRRGLLDMVEGITVHPYRAQPPETVIPDVLRLRALIARHRPDRPDLPIISGEWGYALARPWFNQERQAAYLARQFIVNLSLGIPLSIWFCWNEPQGDDPLATDHYWGVLTQDYQPKPVYREMQRLVAMLGGTRFVKRLESASEDYLMLFSDGRKHVVAAWTAGGEHVTDAIPGQTVGLTGNVEYLPVEPEGTAAALTAWSARARSVGVRAGAVAVSQPAPDIEVHVRNPYAELVQVRLSARGAAGLAGRFAERPSFKLTPGDSRTLHWRGRVTRRSVGQFAATVTADIGGFRSRQQVQFTVANPIFLRATCRPDGRVTALLRNPSGDDFSGLLEAKAGGASASYPIELRGPTGASLGRPLPAYPGSPEITTDEGTAVVVLPLQAQPGKRIHISLRDAGGVVAQDSARIVPLRVSTRTTRAVSDTDGKMPATLRLTDLDPAEALGAISGAVQLTYAFEPDSNWIRLEPAHGLAIRGRPSAIGVWVRGDVTYPILRQRFRDSGGRTFQPCFERLEFEGWRYLTTRLDNPWLQSAGNPDNPHHICYPIRMDSFIMVDHRRRPISGQVRFAGFHLVYDR